MADYIPQEHSKYFGPSMRLGVFWRLDTSPDPIRLWMGVYDVKAGISAIDATGSTYLGAGRLMSVPDLEQLVNGVADRVEFYLSGADAGTFNSLLTSMPVIKGKRCHVGVAPMDERYQLLTPIIPIWTGIADFWIAEEKPVADPTKNIVRTVAISVGSGSTNRSRNKVLSWTDAEHRVNNPTDGFFSRVARYTNTYMVTWPRF